MDVVELPYKVEYARTGRAGCKGCKTNIGQGSVRIAAMVQSAFHDSKQPNWYHESCFFKKQRPLSVGDIQNIENMRFEDQERIRKKVEENVSVVPAAGSKNSKKRSKAEAAASKDFGIEYAKSGRAACRGCELKILKDQVRVRKTVFDTEVGMKYGGQPLWHHVECFAQLRSELGWFDSGKNLPGFEGLQDEDKEIVLKALPGIKSEDVPDAKKPKLEKLDSEDVKSEKELIKTIKEQSKKLFKFRDSVKEEMSKGDMVTLLENNNQEPVSGDTEKLLDQIADLLTFGAIAPCPECKGRQLLFQKSAYVCNGDLTEWTKCSNSVKEPARNPCKIPPHLKSQYKFLKNVNKTIENRAIRYIPPSATTISKSITIKKGDELDGPKVKRERPPLYNLEFAHIGLKSSENDIKQRLMALGGKLDSKITEKTIAVFSTTSEIKGMGSRMKQAKKLGIHVIPIEYIDNVESNNAGAINYISSMTLCDWGTDPAARVPQETPKSMKSKSIYTKSVPKSVTLKIKDGSAVDPDSGLEDIAHIYTSRNKDKYNVVLGKVDLQKNKNSYYKLQLLESDNKNKFWVFRSWGRIGTTIGGNKLEDFSSLNAAIESFHSNYLDKSGNHFQNRANFVKVPNCMYPIDIDYSENDKIDLNVEYVESKLPQSVQEVIKLMFDVDTMKRTMMEFDLDMEKMPLGKLSQAQIKAAYSVLSEVCKHIEEGGSNARFIDCTNRFYTLVPHNFGTASPPLLDTKEQVETLVQMLDSLLEIEYAYNLLQTENTKEDVNPLDKHYEQLKTALEPLDKQSEEFALLKKYVQNTHATTHNMYELEVMDIFKVSRQGEARRYKPFKKLHNRRLLWHGSRLSNFAGILSHGLKIAPPEAPVTGYMFGKGIYFADMVSKSANYCCTSKQNSTGFMLLSEVALGDMLECTAAKYVTKLPAGKHSCFGRGRTMPDPKESIIREDGVEIPLGKPIDNANLKSSLLYNEFIVYDIAQVNIQYMFRMNFKYKY
ncbi:poly [ADP-ribose] polymerase [Stomoxys calcitrans]|uniref:Poly [ADP-ribose] polymerase n=1 Tax=Stomoxys calcitrans TaxID=35570 RepID=A0A1I8PWS2_STOCA|nr:poly [ADP-ribose] polymerase [Stomoxys calcitrans]